MITSTLKGVFPEPKPTHRRNFIRENVSRIKQMQGLIQGSDPEIQGKRKDDKFKNVPCKPSNDRFLIRNRFSSRVEKDEQQRNSTIDNKPDKKYNISQIRVEKQKFFSRGIQTERSEDIHKLYENGIIKYASAGIRRSPKKEMKKISQDHGDAAVRELYDAADSIMKTGPAEKPEHNYVKENIKNIKTKFTNARGDASHNPNQPPPNYQKGVVPKYLKEKKDNERTIDEPDCPPGHILLPEEERKETLRVLRQSYADRVQELNSLPVRSDTLKMKKRKMDIEEELKKIDEGIKVFQRPKVFVKINA